MQIWVIMGNDFPSGVATSEKQAEEKVRLHKESDERHRGLRGNQASIYWRAMGPFNTEDFPT